MRQHRDGGQRKRGLKAQGTRGRWWRRGEEGRSSEKKWGMDGAADQREPPACLALPLKRSQENRLGVLFSPGGARSHKLHSASLLPPLHWNIKTKLYSATCPAQYKFTRCWGRPVWADVGSPPIGLDTSRGGVWKYTVTNTVFVHYSRSICLLFYYPFVFKSFF